MSRLLPPRCVLTGSVRAAWAPCFVVLQVAMSCGADCAPWEACRARRFRMLSCSSQQTAPSTAPGALLFPHETAASHQVAEVLELVPGRAQPQVLAAHAPVLLAPRAGLGGDQATGRQVPGVEPLLDVGVHPPRGHR